MILIWIVLTLLQSLHVIVNITLAVLLLSPFILENKSLLGIKHLVGLLNGMASSPRQINSLHFWCEIRNEAERAGKMWVKTKQRKSTCGDERSGGVARLLLLPIIVYSMYCAVCA